MEIKEKIIELAKSNTEYHKLTGNDAKHREFISKFPSDRITHLTLDEYCVGGGSKDTFSYWLEFGLRDCIGTYSPGSSRGHLIYYQSDGSTFVLKMLQKYSLDEAFTYVLKIHQYIASIDNPEDAKKIDDWQVLQSELGIDTNDLLGDGRKLRILAAYNPEWALPIYSLTHIKYFIEKFGISSNSLKGKPIAAMLQLREIYIRIKEEVEELTPYGFMMVLYSDELGIKPQKNNESVRKVWLYYPGPGGEMWNDFYVKKIMAINSEGLGDLSHYKDQQGLLQQYHKISKGVPEGRLKYWSRFGDYFVNKINENDIIIALSGVATCIGYGVVNSKNVYNASFKPYDNYRDISWEKIESWDISGYGVNVQLGLLEISNKNKYSKFLEEFMAKYIDENGEDGCRTEGNMPETKYELNTILYGPPGTGKTYSVIEKALKITETRYDDREDALEKFKVLQEKGQIEFVTFHQSYSYEEFVEGIKPIPPNIDENPSDNVIYKVKAGVFKKAAELALDNIKYSDSIASNKFMGFSLTDEQMQNDFHKISLGDSTSDEGVRIHEYCIANGLIVMGWGGDIDYSDCDTLSEVKKKYDEEVQKNNYEYSKSNYEFIDRFKNKIKTGDIVFASKGLRTIRAIGVVDGDYQYLPNEEINRCHFRRVKWLLADVEIPISQIYSKQLSQQTTYSLNKSNFIEDFPRNLAENKSPNVVLIIDEINRGNISKIFGELITLIEDSKRIGADDELTVTLPYSGDSFGVPRNLYIIGTMNTADRSIALMDTALRRRFIFEEMMPKYDKLRFKVIDIEIDKMLESINKRITYLYDRDHQIGHAYFIKLKDILDEDHRYSELCSIFANKIIPLLQEYFYDDWSKIQIVLGCHPNQLKPTKNDLKNIDFDDTLNQLVQSKLVEEDKIIGFDHDDLDDSFEYQINPALIETGDKLINPDAFRNIYQLKSLKKDKHETPGS